MDVVVVDKGMFLNLVTVSVFLKIIMKKISSNNTIPQTRNKFNSGHVKKSFIYIYIYIGYLGTSSAVQQLGLHTSMVGSVPGWELGSTCHTAAAPPPLSASPARTSMYYELNKDLVNE